MAHRNLHEHAKLHGELHGANNFSPDALRRLLGTTQVTGASEFLGQGRSVKDYKATIWMYLDRYVQTGELPSLAKAVLKAVSLRTWLLEHRGQGRPQDEQQDMPLL